MPGRESRVRPSGGAKRSNPLGDDLHAEKFASLKQRHLDRAGEEESMDLEGTGGFLLNPKTTKKIFHRARQQLSEIEQDGSLQPMRNDDNEEGAMDMGLVDLIKSQYVAPPAHYDEAIDLDDGGEAVVLDYDDNESVASEMIVEEDPAMRLATSSGPSQNHLEQYYGIDEEEARLLQRFQPESRVQSRHLAGVIMEKIRETAMEEAAVSRRGAEDEEKDGPSASTVDPRVARVYTAIGTVLKRYTSGKIPKAFKVLPNIQNWEELVLLTKPDQWSPHAVYQATRIFSSHLNASMAQRFYAAVLLPIVHERLLEEKKLHPALYMAVRKALFKPVAFFKGFLLPLATDEECTLREALVIASVLQRSHLPPVPTAVALVKIAQQPFRGPCCVFLRVLIDKQMALPYQAIDALVAYFHRFLHTHPKESPLPVLWHQTLLSFVQRYKNDLTMEQVQLLTKVCSTHFHYLISPEIRRELGVAQKMLQQPPQGVAQR